MAKAKNPTTFSSKFKIDRNILSELGVLDITLAIDTKLFIDPLLLKNSRHTEFNIDAYNEFQEHFKKVIKFLVASNNQYDVAWKTALKLLTFPEISGTCLGYSAGSIRGSGFGNQLTSRIIDTANQIVDIGINDPNLFVAMALFEPDIGPDRISDMTTNVIFNALIKFNTRIIKELGLDSQQFIFEHVSANLICNPFENTPIILLPNDILKDLPIAKDWDSVAIAASKNEQLRHEVNTHIAEIWKNKTTRDKGKLKNEALTSKESFLALLSVIKNTDAESYNISSDPMGLITWATKGQDYAKNYPLVLITNQTNSLQDLYAIVYKIIAQFRHLVEHCGLNKDMYKDNSSPKNESASQRLFFAVSYAYCEANNIDISPEIDTGTGKVDFKFSTGFNQRVLVEIKLSTNPKVVSGYTTQLEIYKTSQQTMRAIYLVIDVGSMGKKDEKIIEERNKASKQGSPLSDIEFVDGTLKKSASTR